MSETTVEVLFKYLPLRISAALYSLPRSVLETANELRLRKGGAVSVTKGAKNLFFNEKGITSNPSSAMVATADEINECISRLTNGSLYTCEDFMVNGFIPLAEGGRAGICGRFSKGHFYEITSVNLRLHRFLPNVAAPLVSVFAREGVKGTLVCSPPALGKTTFLRSVAYLLSAGKGIAPVRTALADERAELAASLPADGLLDVVSGMPKAEAITLLTRSMAPQVIICDEISATDAEAVSEAQNTGVALIASAHCVTPKELLKRGRMKAILTSGIFEKTVILSYNGAYNCEIYETESFL